MKIITGTHTIEEMLKNGVPKGSTLYVLKAHGKVKALELMAFSCHGVIVKKADSVTLDRLSPDNHGAVLVMQEQKSSIHRRESVSVKEFCDRTIGEENIFVVILDGLTDPHNLGAVLRSADCFSVDLVIYGKSRSAGLSETALRVSSGAASYVDTSESVNLVRDIKMLKDAGFWIYAADMKGENSRDVRYSGKTAIVLGREGEGLHQSVKKECDYIVSIPMTGHIDSLNVSVAAGILMYDYRMKCAKAGGFGVSV